MYFKLSLKIFVVIILFNSSLRSQVYNVKKGEIEFIGLKNRDGQILLDSLKIISPNKPIHVCAANFKSKFHFADASVIVYFNKDYSRYTVVTLIEPEFADLIKYKEPPKEELPPISGWTEGTNLFKNNPRFSQIALMSYIKIVSGKKDSANIMLKRMHIDKNKIEPFWEFLHKQNTVEDKDIALWILEHDANVTNRMLALAVLINFTDSDIVWWKLLDAQRSSDTKISSLSTIILSLISRDLKHKVDWQPAVNTIRYIIDGTNPFAFLTTLSTLTNTEISPDLSTAIFKDGADLLFAYLNAKHKKTSKTALNFASQISGHKIKSAQEFKDWFYSNK